MPARDEQFETTNLLFARADTAYERYQVEHRKQYGSYTDDLGQEQGDDAQADDGEHERYE